MGERAHTKGRESRAYYNELDPYAAQWLRNLIAGGHIAPGDVDERSIVDVRPSDLEGGRKPGSRSTTAPSGIPAASLFSLATSSG